MTSQQTLLSTSKFIFLILHFVWKTTVSLLSPADTVSRTFSSTTSSTCAYAKNVNGLSEIPRVLSWIPSLSFGPKTFLGPVWSNLLFYEVHLKTFKPCAYRKRTFNFKRLYCFRENSFYTRRLRLKLLLTY